MGGSEGWGEGCEEEEEEVEGCWEEGWGGVREHFGDGGWRVGGMSMVLWK